MTDIKFVKINAGSFNMGGGDIELKPDALPVHRVNISSDFYISEEPVKYSLFKKFYMEMYNEFPDVKAYKGFVIGVSWDEANEFCKWLSIKDKTYYRLPTEAEWEYCARNSRTNGVDRMCDMNMREWCFDWYGSYEGKEEIDPAGADTGFYKVVRGGFLDNPLRYNEYPLDVWMRCSLPSDFRHFKEDCFNDFGRHYIGFRLVQGKLTVTNGKRPVLMLSLNVKQDKHISAVQNTRPYFRKRFLFPVPPDNSTSEEIKSFGLNPLIRHHNHSPGFDVAPNGDLIVSIYSTYHEYDAESGLMGVRLKYGAEEWEQPDIFLNPVGVNDHAPLIFTDDDGTIYHFWGWQQLDCSFPFQYVYSKDSGATWSETIFPLFINKAERVIRQPINSAFKAKDGYYYLACDATEGSASVLWRSRDLLHWENPKGRTAGRHTTAVELKDGRILAMGGKNSDIDGYMPKAVSSDRGDTWVVSKTPFPALTSGQRPCIIRLKSGRLFMCGDYQNKQGLRPEDFIDDKWGSYAAYSEDEGETWTLKKLWGTQKKKRSPELLGGADTLGYSVCRQSPDGLIHIITSNTHPCLHLCFNEAWLLAAEETSPKDSVLMGVRAGSISNVKKYSEYYEDGSIKCIYSGGIADDGRFLLDGEEKWFYPSGELMSECTYKSGCKTGSYIYYDIQGFKIWEWRYLENNVAIYKTFYEENKIKSVGRYKGKIAEGIAQTYSRKGELLTEVYYESGRLVRRKDIKKEIPTPMAEILEA